MEAEEEVKKAETETDDEILDVESVDDEDIGKNCYIIIFMREIEKKS